MLLCRVFANYNRIVEIVKIKQQRRPSLDYNVPKIITSFSRSPIGLGFENPRIANTKTKITQDFFITSGNIEGPILVKVLKLIIQMQYLNSVVTLDFWAWSEIIAD
ncbi:hypothetical protein Zmor_016074 [Zophobas morio]|uniref:Uncharacterized protein n=1 Tax=Zophobas morio TaxID=2755281 RepID=A0AA38MI87_9CUCU|nr:hypothetical protein Zmor_016074 [Zophobas morio]